MPSHPHEGLLRLFRNNARLALELLGGLQIDIPEYSEAVYDSENLTDLKPAEYRADLVMVLLLERATPALGIIVEVQLSVDKDKQYTWPAYVANLRARIRCPVWLLILAGEDSVARWAGRVIELGGGSRVVPLAFGPKDIPLITDPQRAENNVELAVLSARAHGNDADIQLATRIVRAALNASARLDAERSAMYVDLILTSVSEAVQRELRAMPMMREYMSDFARRYVAEGVTQGRAEGTVETRCAIILRVLSLRFGPLPEAMQVRIRDACGRHPDSIVDEMLTAKTLDEALGAL